MSWRVAAVLFLTAWGALAFGAVYPWAFLPLFVASGLAGLTMFLIRFGSGNLGVFPVLTLVLLVAAVGFQLVPISISTIRSISPTTDLLLLRSSIGYPPSSGTHPLSIDPRATLIGFSALSAISVLLLGLARAITRDDTFQIARGIAILGAVLAIAGIIQKAMWNGKIYGFWTPNEPGDSFGPFVNRNHFAGWVLMSAPLCVGYLFSRASRATRSLRPGLRNRLVWLSSAEASEIILVGFAVLLMALALTLSGSRSGMLGLLAALALSSWFVARRQTASGRAVLMGYLVFVVFLSAWWTGFDTIAARFSFSGAAGTEGRLGIWKDTWNVATLFPIVGTGFNTFQVAALFYQTVDPQHYFSASHNDYLQLVAEGGALVCIPAALVMLTFAWIIRSRVRERSVDPSDYWLRIGAVTGILAIGLQEFVDFSLQIPGNAVLFAVVLAIAIRPANISTAGSGPR